MKFSLSILALFMGMIACLALAAAMDFPLAIDATMGGFVVVCISAVTYLLHRQYAPFMQTTAILGRWSKGKNGIRCVGNPRKAESGAIANTVGMFRDIFVRMANAEAMNQMLVRIVEDSINEIFVFDAETLNFEMVNAVACRNLGYTMEELMEMTPLDLKPEYTPEGFEKLVAKLRCGEKNHVRLETVHRRKDGSSYDVNITLQYIRSQSRPVFAAIVEDVTDRKESERLLAQQASSMALLNMITVAANQSGNVKDTLGYCIEQVCLFTGWEVGHAYISDEDDPGRMESARCWHMTNDRLYRTFQKTTEGMSQESGMGLVGQVMEQATPYWTADMMTDPNCVRAEAAKSSGLKGGAAFPVKVRGEIVAILEFFSTHPLEPDPQLIDILAHVAAQIGQVVERQRSKKKLTDQNERFNAALEYMSQGLCMFDGDQRLIISNGRYASMYGLKPDEVKPGQRFRQILESRIANSFYTCNDPEKYIQERCSAVIEDTASMKVQELSDGRFIAISHQPMPDGGWLATHEDITELRRIEERLAHQAHHDALTGLPNREKFRERMDEELKRALRGGSFALLCLDLDGFKSVNDTLGHAAGDELLKHVAERLRNCVRETDTIARLGGDEFAVIQISTGQPVDATTLARRICKAVRAPITLGDNEVVVETSIGIAIAPKDGIGQEQLLKNADMALYRAKRDGRGTYCFFEQEMEVSVQDRHTLGLDLRKALAQDELQLHYQPLLNLENDRISGFEALLRWRHPERGMVPPSEFIPIAEETGQISQIGEWVLRQACSDAADWPEDIKIAVNVSPVQFQRGNLLQVVGSALTATGLSPSRLELEVTESVLLQDEEETLDILHRLHDLGLRISMDDFGTGYSSLSYLRSFPFDKIKIDATFVRDLSEDNDGIGIVQAVVGFASRLGAETTAEGVETDEQLAIIRADGCTEAQGYLFSPPRPLEDVSHMLLKRGKGMENAA